MAIVDKTTLKSWFRNFLKPTQEQFWNWMDSYWHKSEKIPQSSIEGWDEFLQEIGNVDLSNYLLQDGNNLTEDNRLLLLAALRALTYDYEDADGNTFPGSGYTKEQIHALLAGLDTKKYTVIQSWAELPAERKDGRYYELTTNDTNFPTFVQPLSVDEPAGIYYDNGVNLIGKSNEVLYEEVLDLLNGKMNKNFDNAQYKNLIYNLRPIHPNSGILFTQPSKEGVYKARLGSFLTSYLHDNYLVETIIKDELPENWFFSGQVIKEVDDKTELGKSVKLEVPLNPTSNTEYSVRIPFYKKWNDATDTIYIGLKVYSPNEITIKVTCAYSYTSTNSRANPKSVHLTQGINEITIEHTPNDDPDYGDNYGYMWIKFDSTVTGGEKIFFKEPFVFGFPGDYKPSVPEIINLLNRVGEHPIVEITQNGITGYGFKGRKEYPEFYGDIGEDAIDLSYSDEEGDFGATGIGSIATGEYNKAKGDLSIVHGFRNVAETVGEFCFGVYAELFPAKHAESKTKYYPDDVLINIGIGHNENPNVDSDLDGTPGEGVERKSGFVMFKNGAFRFLNESLARITNAVKGFHAADEQGRLNYFNSKEWVRYALISDVNSGICLGFTEPVDGMILINSKDVFQGRTWTINYRSADAPSFALTESAASVIKLLDEFTPNKLCRVMLHCVDNPPDGIPTFDLTIKTIET